MLRLISCSALARSCSGTLLIATLLSGLGCRGSDGTLLSDLDHARALAADLRLQFSKVDKASDQAVMADTDEASIAFAKEAEQATSTINGDVAALAPVLKGLGFSRELGAFDAFQANWSKYQKLDQEVLALAIENTNLKAQRLSFGPAREAADAFRDAVATTAAGVGGKEHCGASELAQRAVVAVREIQVLQAPHIAEADDAAMTRMEQDMAGLEQKVREALTALSNLGGTNAGPGVAKATAALGRFRDVSAQIVSLSRRNTNVRSLALSLREQPTRAVACDDSLRTLQQALDSEGTKATR